MPTQEVARAARPSALLQCDERRRDAVLLDGGGPDSWLHGDVIYSDTPSATLSVYPSGWGCWRSDGAEHWRWADPLVQWEEFLSRHGAGGVGGVVTVLAYDLKHWIERLPRRQPWPTLPVLYCARYDWAYRASYRARAAHVEAATDEHLGERVRWLAAAGVHASRRVHVAPRPRACPRPALGRRAYTAMIAEARQYIAAGDVYEINLAQPFTVAATRAQAPALFGAWTERYPMPLAAYVDAADWTIVSNSPECLLASDGVQVATLPIKGTRRRDPGSAPEAIAAALRADPKEQAEHVMVVDLERNDLGRVCVPGTVQVAELATVRHYPALVHMVSEVRGRLRDGITPSALMRAVFPGGSITGAPKVRAMQLIEALEPAPRGFYTGAIGWTEPNGDMRFNIAIRTAVFEGGGLTYWAGGGIVADSDPDREYEETLLKSETFFRALASLEGRPA